MIYSEDGEAVAQTAQRSCTCPIPESVQGQVGQGPAQPELGGGSQLMAGAWDWMCFKVSSSPDHSMIL